MKTREGKKGGGGGTPLHEEAHGKDKEAGQKREEGEEGKHETRGREGEQSW